MDIGALTVFLYTFREREEILRIFEMVSGQRMMTSYFRIGGLAMEPPLGFFDRVQAFIKTFPEKIDEYSNLLTGNPIFINRLKGVGYLSQGRRHRARRHRPGHARLGHRLRPAPRHALLELREVPVPRAGLE